MYSSPALEARSPKSVTLGQNQGVSRVTLPLKALDENPFFSLAASSGCVTPISAPWSHGLLFCVSQINLFFPIIKTLVIALSPLSSQ